jgi:hypothetical protein
MTGERLWRLYVSISRTDPFTPMAALALGNEVSHPDFFSRGAAESAEVGGLDFLRELRVSA